MRTAASAQWEQMAGGGIGAFPSAYRVVVDGTTYDNDRIPLLIHLESEDSFQASVVLDNGDAFFGSSFLVKGLQADISYGINGAYSQCAPLWVLDQREDTYAGRKVIVLDCIGIPDRIKDDEASANFQPEPGDTTTVLTYLQHVLSNTASSALPAWVAGSTRGTADYVTPTSPNGWYYKCTAAGTAGSAEPTWAVGMKQTVADSAVTWTAWGRAATIYSHAPQYTVTVDSAETLLTSAAPADALKVQYRESRWNVTNKLLSYVRTVPRAESAGQLHVILPVVSGTAYDYTYDSTGSTTHSYANKHYSQRVVTPNYVTVDSMPADTVHYTASTANTADNALLNARTFRQSYLASTAQANSIGSAVISKFNLQASKGRFTAPVNVDQEIYDYIQVIDGVGASFTGNVTSILRVVGPGAWNMEIVAGELGQREPLPLMPPKLLLPQYRDFEGFFQWFSTVFTERLNALLAGSYADWRQLRVDQDMHNLLTTQAHGKGIPLVVMKPADAAYVTSDTALADDSDLKCYVAANEKWLFHLDLLEDAQGVAPDMKTAWSYPANCSIWWGEWASTAVVSRESDTAVYESIAGTRGLHLRALVVNAGTAGVVNFQWTQNTSSTAGVRLLRGSAMTCHRLEAA